MKKVLIILALTLSLAGCAPLGANCYCPEGQFYCENRPVLIPHPWMGFVRGVERDCFCHKPLTCPAIEVTN